MQLINTGIQFPDRGVEMVDMVKMQAQKQRVVFYE
jgi:hypothetical protein